MGMVIGVLVELFGIFGMSMAFNEPQQAFLDITLGGLFVFFGLMTFFVARIRKRSFSVSKAKKNEAIVGMLLSIAAIILGVIVAVIGAITSAPTNTNDSGIAAGVFIIIEGAVIWWVTRIRIKKTP
jgi:TRAP-type C4-dicarboxylate transport system permease large subunit